MASKSSTSTDKADKSKIVIKKQRNAAKTPKSSLTEPTTNKSCTEPKTNGNDNSTRTTNNKRRRPKSPTTVKKVRQARRSKANDRERKRMHLLNDALEKLRDALPPAASPDTSSKLTKIDTLRLAYNHIWMLTEMMGDSQKLDEYEAKGLSNPFASVRPSSSALPMHQFYQQDNGRHRPLTASSVPAGNNLNGSWRAEVEESSNLNTMLYTQDYKDQICLQQPTSGPTSRVAIARITEANFTHALSTKVSQSENYDEAFPSSWLPAGVDTTAPSFGTTVCHTYTSPFNRPQQTQFSPPAQGYPYATSQSQTLSFADSQKAHGDSSQITSHNNYAASGGSVYL